MSRCSIYSYNILVNELGVWISFPSPIRPPEGLSHLHLESLADDRAVKLFEEFIGLSTCTALGYVVWGWNVEIDGGSVRRPKPHVWKCAFHVTNLDRSLLYCRLEMTPLLIF